MDFEQKNQEFEQKIKVAQEKNVKSLERFLKKIEQDKLKINVVDMTPWLPKNVTQIEINDYCERHPDRLKSINNTFKTRCQKIQVLRECVILARDYESELKRWYRASLKKFLGLNKDEIKKVMKDLEYTCPNCFKV